MRLGALDLGARMRGTVWDTAGCVSFYLDARGRNATLWPDFTWRFRRRALNFDAADPALSAREVEREPGALTA